MVNRKKQGEVELSHRKPMTGETVRHDYQPLSRLKRKGFRNEERGGRPPRTARRFRRIAKAFRIAAISLQIGTGRDSRPGAALVTVRGVETLSP